MKVALKNLGCAKNQVDAEYLLGELKEVGHQIIADFSQAECIIVNTCGFIDTAKEESISEIFELLQYKTEGNCKIFIVTGCLAQRYAEKLITDIPEIDAVVGVGAIAEIRDMFHEEIINTRNILKDGSFLNTSGMPRHFITSSKSVYLKIADGCDNNCTYCAIPSIRGPYKSRKFEDLVDEVKALVTSGVKEINVIAQDTTSYGIDIYKERKLADLLAAISSLDGDYWVRVLYCYPEYIDDKLISVIASSPKICKYIDMPIQHVHPEIVKKMRRRMSGDELKLLINKIRAVIPDVFLRSTFLIGFPGEKKEHFAYLKQFVQEIKLDWAGVFMYSREENTPAYKLPQQVDARTKNRRKLKLLEVQNPISAQRLERLLGQTLQCLVEGKSEVNEELYEGRTKFHAPDVDGVVYFTSKSDLSSGEFVEIVVTHVDGLDVIGEIKA